MKPLLTSLIISNLFIIKNDGIQSWGIYHQLNMRKLSKNCLTSCADFVDHYIRDRTQNHALYDVASKHYDRHDYFDEKYEGLYRWEQELMKITKAG